MGTCRPGASRKVPLLHIRNVPLPKPRVNAKSSLSGRNYFITISAGLTIIANVAIATGPALFGARGLNKSHLLHYIQDLFQSKKPVFC